MALRLESTSGGPMGSGFLPVHEGSQPPAPVHLTRHTQLHERYGVPLLELLVVDPYFIFISWEITPAQLEQARSQFGTEFEDRRLRVLMFDAKTGTQLSGRELYGDLGRWFIQLNHPGVWLRAELQFHFGSNALTLNSTGPVFIPRDMPIEPERWEELFVTYARSEKGELRIESIEREHPDWPRIGLDVSDTHTHFGGTGSAEHVTSAQRQIDAALLRPLLPLAPASVEESDD